LVTAHPIPIGNPTAISRAIAGPPDSKAEIEYKRDGEAKQVSVLRKGL